MLISVQYFASVREARGSNSDSIELPDSADTKALLSVLPGGNSILRGIHYPPITTNPGDSVRAGQHEDINLITLLMGASADGLEVLNKKGEWIGITAIPGSLVVNVGDMLQRLTNGMLKSTTHRVVNPPREKWGTSRYSIPFFLHPVGKMPLNTLPISR